MVSSENASIELVVIVGSVRTGRFGPVVAAWFADVARSHPGFSVSVVDLAEYDVSHSFDDTPETASFCGQISPAEAFVIVTPEYNHSFPGNLKSAIDCTDKEFAGKPVAFVSYGGLSGGLRAVEALRVVMSEVHAITIREAVSIHRVKTQFVEDGSPIEPVRIEESATRMLDQLAWWAEAARRQRDVAAYPG